MKPWQILLPIFLFCGFTIWILNDFDEKMYNCNNWRKDITDCKQKECCIELRNKQPNKCFLPKEACSIYE